MQKKLRDEWGNRLGSDGFRLYTGTDERGNGQETIEEWRAQRRAFRRAKDVKEPLAARSSVTAALLEDAYWVAEIALELRPSLRTDDRFVAHCKRLLAVQAAEQKFAAGASKRAAHARSHIANPGRPKISLLVTSPQGTATVVQGYKAAEQLTGFKAIAVRMSMRAEDKLTLGKGDRIWTIQKVAQSLHNATSVPTSETKRENEAGEKLEGSARRKLLGGRLRVQVAETDSE